MRGDNTIMLTKIWTLGVKDRGIDHGGFAVITIDGELVVECTPRSVYEHFITSDKYMTSEKLANHIIKLHNDSLFNQV